MTAPAQATGQPPGLDPIGWFIATLHEIIGHDAARRVCMQEPGPADATGCLLCRYESTRDPADKAAAIAALQPTEEWLARSASPQPASADAAEDPAQSEAQQPGKQQVPVEPVDAEQPQQQAERERERSKNEPHARPATRQGGGHAG